jgi:predicted nucleic acid-binding protein
MILVDSSVWINHLRNRNQQLAELLEAGEIATHTCVIGELACGTLSQRSLFLARLGCLQQCPESPFTEVMNLIEKHHLWGRGLSWADVHIISSAHTTEHEIWTDDKAMQQAASEIGLVIFHV